MMDLIIYLGVIVILALVVWFLLSKISLPEPAGTIIQVAVVVIVAVIVVGMLLSLRGGGLRLGSADSAYQLSAQNLPAGRGFG